MVVAGGKKCGLPAHPHLELKTQHVAIKTQRALQVRHFEMHVTDTNLGVNGAGWQCCFHGGGYNLCGADRDHKVAGVDRCKRFKPPTSAAAQ